MKKFLKLFAIVLAIFMVMAIFAACHKKTNDPDTPDKPVDNTPVDDNPTPDNPTPDTPVHEHAWDEGTVTKEATCTEAGEKVYKCSGCEETKVEVIAALGHTWDEGVVTKEPTVAEEGVKKFTCTVCGETKEEPIEKLAVEPKPPVVDAKYKENADGTYTYLYYIGPDDATEVVIPATFNGKSVVRIDDLAFKGFPQYTKITISEGIKAIGESAFEGCTGLTEITIPASVTQIEDNAFKGCTGLQKVKLLATVGEELPASAFAGCTQIAFLELGDGITELATGTFASAEKSLVSLTIGKNMADLKNNFESAYAYKLVYVKNNSTVTDFEPGTNVAKVLKNIADAKENDGVDVEVVTDTNGYVFYLDENEKVSLIAFVGEDQAEDKDSTKKTLELPEDYKEDKYTIYKYAFYGRTDINTVIIDKGVTAIGVRAFADCFTSTTEGLKAVTFVAGSKLTTIGNNAFENCKALTAIVIPDKVATIGAAAFTNCVSLATITLGAQVETISSYAFSSTAVTALTIPATVTTIGYSAFYNCATLAEVTFKGSATEVDATAFGGATATVLKTATIPGNVHATVLAAIPGLVNLTITSNIPYTTAGKFAGNTTLKTVVISEGVTEIGQEAFSNCTALTSVQLADTITTIGAAAFADCTSLTGTTTESNLVYLAKGTNTHFAVITGITASECTVHADTKVISADGLNGKEIVTFADGITAIPAAAAKDNDTIWKVIIPASVTTIGDSAFYDCTGLATITFSGDLTTWGDVQRGTDWAKGVLASGVDCSDALDAAFDYKNP